jgi:hypothetical protein
LIGDRRGQSHLNFVADDARDRAKEHLALAQAQSGNSQWQDTLDDPERDAEFEAWLEQQVASA